MTSPVDVSYFLVSRLVWLDLVFTQPLDAARVSAFMCRLRGYLGDSGLTPALVLGRSVVVGHVVVVGAGHALTQLDCHLVACWLIEQPEVARVSFPCPDDHVRTVSKEGYRHA